MKILPWCIGVSDVYELNYKTTERSMVLKAPFLTCTESFDVKGTVKAYTDVADSCMLLLWLTDCYRDTVEKK